MSHPEFFERVPRLRARDPLAEFLGASDDGILEYGYADAVRLAGHSCPTVAAAYRITLLGLARLYGRELPERGGVRVDIRQAQEEGVAGVIGAVASLLTGTAGEGGFRGLGGRFGRRGLLRYGVTLPLDYRFTRLDTGAAVDCGVDLRHVPADPEMPLLMQKCLQGQADRQERERFAGLWQDRVRRLLTEHWEDPRVFVAG
ncbi:MAG: hypothetical protein JNK22_08090 [Rhodocyclaceae bacterium]|nr:hypothetical protein [Rhodocyclaceae bacterium]